MDILWKVTSNTTRLPPVESDDHCLCDRITIKAVFLQYVMKSVVIIVFFVLS